jgi:hypothetical protein
MRHLRWLLLLLVLGVARAAFADVVGEWNRVALDAIRADRVPPPRASRLLALVHVAAFDAVNAARRKYDPYVVVIEAPPGVDLDTVYAAAAHRVLVAELPARAPMFDAALAGSLEHGSRRRREISLAWGRGAADVLLALRADDGHAVVAPYAPSGRPGGWMPTPPPFAPALLPGWPAVTPWCLPDGDALRAPEPPPLASDAYAVAFAEVQALGRADSATRTPEQTEIAHFWNDGPGTATPPGHWNDIARVVAQERRLTFIQRARLFALLNLGLADAAIVAWDTKYAYDHWRPVTAIRAADVDGNPTTEPDLEWTSLLPTPPFPAYTSGHSTFSATAATILALVLGRDDVPFAIGSDGLPGVERRFSRLSAAAEEAGQSRIYGGIHWQYDNEDGQRAGRELGTMVVESLLRPSRDRFTM